MDNRGRELTMNARREKRSVRRKEKHAKRERLRTARNRRHGERVVFHHGDDVLREEPNAEPAGGAE